jgi:DNA-binding response OmpR family regulator
MRPLVLIAEADELLAAAYRAFLVAEGFDVLWVNNGLDYLEQIRGRTPQALILDAELPGGSGAGVLAMLAGDADLPYIPAVLFTVKPSSLARHGRGIVAVTLLKPVAPSKVARTLRDLLEAGELVRLK